MMARGSRSWVWFFAALAVLAIAAVAINWTYNARQQLTPEQLAAAEERWKQHGPADYDLEVEKIISGAASDAAVRDRITVRVRRGQVVAAELNGAELERRLWPEYDMPSWLSYVEEFLR